MNDTTPTRAKVIVLKRILNLISRGMTNRHALEIAVEGKARSCSVVPPCRQGMGLLRGFKVRNHAVNSTVIQLVAN